MLKGVKISAIKDMNQVSYPQFIQQYYEYDMSWGE